MAKLKKFVAFRRLERPFTRYSKYRKKGFVKARPGKRVVKYDMGDVKATYDKYPLKLVIVSKNDIQVRTNSLEAARVQTLRLLNREVGKQNFYFRIKKVPYHVLRENPLAAGAGADRLSTGMKHSFGKSIGTAAQVKKGEEVFEVWLPDDKEKSGRKALEAALRKLPLKGSVYRV